MHGTDTGAHHIYATSAAAGVEESPLPVDQPTPLLTRYMMMALRRKWTILGAIAACLIAAILFTLLVTPRYTATTRIEVAREGTRILSNVENVQPETSTADQEFYQTQYEVLASRTLADRVAKTLRLADDEQFFRTMRARAVANSFDHGRSNLPRAKREEAAAAILLAKVSIVGIRTSSLIDIEWTSPDPALSAKVSNTWATSFIEFSLERRYDASSYARGFLQQRLEQLRQRLEQSERQLVGYAQQQAIVDVPVGGTDSAGHTSQRSLTVDSLAALNTSLSEATADRIRAESRLQSLRAGALSEQLNNSTVNTLRQRRAELAADYAKMMEQFSPAYPPAEALQAQITQIDKSLQHEQQYVASGLSNAYDDARGREQLLTDKVNQLRNAFLDQRRRGIQYNIFQRDVDANRELYNGLLQRLKEVSVAAGASENNISIIDQAQVPTRPSFPRPFLNLLGGLVLGLVLGLGIAFAREQVDETIADPADLERRLGVPLLGGVPEVTTDPFHELRDPKSGLTEAYLSIQASLSFVTDHGLPRSIAVTSTRPAEGKSTTAVAFGYLMGRTGKRTLLIDGDMRSPSVHRNLGMTNEIGLSAVLSGITPAAGAIVPVPDMPFNVMTAGKSPPNAAELLRGHRLRELLDELHEHYDCIVIDAPPVMGLADAPTIASVVEGTVFVMESRGVKQRLARIALERLRQAHAHLVGAVMTKLRSNRAGYGYGYDYGYGYGTKSDD